MSNGTARPATVADVLDAAADHIQRVGLVHEYLVDDKDGRCCAAGAINYVIFGEADPSVMIGERARLASASKEALIDEVHPHRTFPSGVDLSEDEWVGKWNDVHTADEVIATLRRVAAEHRATDQRSSPHTGGA